LAKSTQRALVPIMSIPLLQADCTAVGNWPEWWASWCHNSITMV